MMTHEHQTDPNQAEAAERTTGADALNSFDTQIDELKAELAKVAEDALRERAELDNQRKRLARDVEMARKFANERLLSELLPVIDSLEAGLAVAGADANALRDGMELTLRQLLKVVSDNGLVAVDPTGQPFNPEHHQAMSMVDSADHAPGHVVQVYQKGWLLNERLLRPALVVVAKDA